MAMLAPDGLCVDGREWRAELTIRPVIVGAYEHPRRRIPDRTVAEIHWEVARGALNDAGLEFSDVDAFCCDSTAPGLGALSMAEYLGLQPSFVDNTETGGSSYLAHVGHVAAAMERGECRVALISLAGLPRSPMKPRPPGPEDYFERVPFAGPVGSYAMVAARHMYEFGTTSAQLAEIKVAASVHASHNPLAYLPNQVTIDEVVSSPIVADPLHRLDCCVVTDGGGALVVVHPDVAKDLGRAGAEVLGHGTAVWNRGHRAARLTSSAAVQSGAMAFAQAGVTAQDIQYASIYDSFTITVLVALEDLGFCAKGQGGHFVEDGGLLSPTGRLPFNTDGGGLCNNHPANRGGMTKVIEAVRQLRGEAAPALQVPGCELALAHGTGGSLGSRHGCATLVLGAWS